MDTHDHDWRIDPHAPLRTTNPPQVRHVCADCGEERWWVQDAPSGDPKDWPKPAGA